MEQKSPNHSHVRCDTAIVVTTSEVQLDELELLSEKTEVVASDDILVQCIQQLFDLFLDNVTQTYYAHVRVEVPVRIHDEQLVSDKVCQLALRNGEQLLLQHNGRDRDRHGHRDRDRRGHGRGVQYHSNNDVLLAHVQNVTTRQHARLDGTQRHVPILSHEAVNNHGRHRHRGHGHDRGHGDLHGHDRGRGSGHDHDRGHDRDLQCDDILVIIHESKHEPVDMMPRDKVIADRGTRAILVSMESLPLQHSANPTCIPQKNGDDGDAFPCDAHDHLHHHHRGHRGHVCGGGGCVHLCSQSLNGMSHSLWGRLAIHGRLERGAGDLCRRRQGQGFEQGLERVLYERRNGERLHNADQGSDRALLEATVQDMLAVLVSRVQLAVQAITLMFKAAVLWVKQVWEKVKKECGVYLHAVNRLKLTAE